MTEGENWARQLGFSSRREAITQWTDDAYTEFREFKRDPSLLEDDEDRAEVYENFVAGLQTAPNYRGVGWRGIRVYTDEQETLSNFLADVGTTTRWDTWTSNTANPATAEAFSRGTGTGVVFEIYSPNPYGRWINSVSSYLQDLDDEGEVDESLNENEFIMAPSSFRVVNAFKGTVAGESRIIVQLELIEEEDITP